MNSSTPTDIARLLVDVSRRLYEKGFVSANDGNISTRLPDGNILVTPSGRNKGRISADDLVVVTQEGDPVSGARNPTTELGMHLFIYRRRPDVHAVVHAHPTYATGFAAARIALEKPVFPEVIVGLGTVPVAPYGTPSTNEVAESIAPFVEHAWAILLANHGVVTYGPDLDDAYFKMEKVEHAAHMLFVARMLGGERSLTPQEVQRLLAVAHTLHGRRSS
jgi:L-fuculose-phosphate aldolase